MTPRTFPEGSVQLVINFIRGNTTDKWAVIEAAHDILGYAISMVRGTKSIVAGVPGDNDAAFELECLIKETKRLNNLNVKQSENENENESEGEGEGEGEQEVKKTYTGNLQIPQWLIAFLLQLLQKQLTT